MGRNAMNFLARVLNSSKIKEYEIRIENIYLEDWKDKPWEEYAIDITKLQSDSINLINKSSGTERMKYKIGLQALYNSKKKEIDFVENMIQSMPIGEYKFKFSSEYDKILSKIGKEDDLPWEMYIEVGKVANSRKIKSTNAWLHIESCLVIMAIDELFGETLDKFQEMVRK